ENIPVPSLAHGLDRVLFNPGVYYLQDPRSHIYNFDPYLQQITPVEEFNFDALSEYITSSRDSTLDELARENGLSVVGSTSSMTTTLAQFHFLLSANRPVNLSRLSTAFVGKSTDFTPSQRAPTSIYLRHNDGIYAIDADKSLDSGETVLSFLGRSMEKMLTLVPEDFSKLRKDRQAEPRPAPSRESYHYSKIGQMLMRSQLDCHDPRLPGTGTFDLKTRAVLPVRLDVRNHATGAGYQIVRSTGILESFEREYYDMIRAAFLKYSLQVRIGKMDGIFVAYHNTERIFGFQYISIDEMDECLHGSSTDNIAGREFVMSLKQLDKVLKMAIDKYPGRSMCLSFQTTTGKKPVMEIVVEAMSEEEIQKRQ
ncbi:mitochondrial protein Pet127-domain-containing protein, partial [Protomyces lactucae-debilis]